MEVRSKLEEAAEALHLPPWPAAAAQAHPPASTILARRFGKGLRLLAAVAAFEGVLAREQLMAIALDKLITRQVSLVMISYLYYRLWLWSRVCWRVSSLSSWPMEGLLSAR